jgi:hypothetical protein
MQFARAELGRMFIWGETNCVALALRAHDAMHGTALHATHRKHMSTATRARAWTRKHGARGVIDQLLADGLTELSPAFAQPGDLLIGETADGQIAAHVCLGARVLSSTETEGVRYLPLAAVSPAPTFAAGWRAA